MNPTPAPVVIKLGGRALEAGPAVAELAADLARLAAPAVVVHGGGFEVSQWCERLGIAPRRVDGLRVTDAGTLEVVVAVLAGLANKRLVAALRHHGLDAVGLAALDGGLITCGPHPLPSLGRVGEPRAAHLGLVRELWTAGRLPVIASIGALAGELINLNADDVAVTLAAAAGAQDLIMLSDAPGLILDGVRVARLGAGDLAEALDHADVKDGMRAKLRAIAQACAAGVVRVHLGAWEGPGTLRRAFSGEWSGTRIADPDLLPQAELAVQEVP